jgi:hypothetical protein
MKKDRPDCYTCEYRREVAGSAHSKCAHPSIGESDPMEELMAIFASVQRVPAVIGDTKELNVVGSPHGIRNGWFNWPYNFDPVWLEECDGYSFDPATVAFLHTVRPVKSGTKKQSR